MTQRPHDRARDEDYVDLSPGDPDYDLSEEAGYSNWEPQHSEESRQKLIVVLSVLLLVALALPFLLRLAHII
jgi:hypothetical protein